MHALAYLRLVNQPADDLAFERIVNVPKRGLGDATVGTACMIAHLERGAHQDGDLVERVLLALQLFDVVADRARLLLGIPGRGNGDFLAVLIFGAQRLAQPAFVVSDQVRGSRQDMAGRAVIALQPDVRAGRCLKRRILSTSAPRQPYIDWSSSPTQRMLLEARSVKPTPYFVVTTAHAAVRWTIAYSGRSGSSRI